MGARGQAAVLHARRGAHRSGAALLRSARGLPSAAARTGRHVVSRCRAIHGDESGQSIVYIVLILFLLACFTVLVINSGALLHHKVRGQGAADAAVYSGTTWIVRGMNINSMLNILLAMMFAQVIYMKAVYWTAVSALVLTPALEVFYIIVCIYSGSCDPVSEVPGDVPNLIELLDSSDDAESDMWDYMEMVSSVEEGVHYGFEAASFGESVRVGVMNGAAFGAMYPFTIPTEQKTWEVPNRSMAMSVMLGLSQLAPLKLPTRVTANVVGSTV